MNKKGGRSDLLTQENKDSGASLKGSGVKERGIKGRKREKGRKGRKGGN